MLGHCNICNKELLTEADHHAWIFQGKWRLNCGCYFVSEHIKNLENIKEQVKLMQSKIDNLEKKAEYLMNKKPTMLERF